jgi:SdpC family antimicrobial peptide
MLRKARVMRKCFLVCVLAVVLVYYSTPGILEVSSYQARVAYDGETIFQGLFFGKGPVAQLFPEIWEDPVIKRALEQNAEEMNRLIERVITRIHNEDPTFFQRFGREVQSGDHLRVQQALEQGAQRLITALDQEGLLPPKEAALGLQLGQCIVFVIALAVVLVVVVAVAVAVVLWLWLWTPTPELWGVVDRPTELTRDMMVDWVTTRLSVEMP